MKELNFTDYIDTLEAYNKKYKDCEKKRTEQGEGGTNQGEDTENLEK